jgi:Ca2+-transporting ATPase
LVYPFLLAIHILCNLVTDGLPGLALASEPAEDEYNERPPKSDENAICRKDGIAHTKCWFTNGCGSLLSIQYWAIQANINIGKQLLLQFSVSARWMLWQFVLRRIPFKIGVFRTNLFWAL